MKRKTIVVIGGGAAGFMAAITTAEQCSGCRVVILERSRQVLDKVRISGGGRCNVTHACFSPRELVQHYPRGSKALLGPYTRFGCQDTVHWFRKRGVSLHAESDGRMFPVTNDSMTIVKCLIRAAEQAGVDIRTTAKVTDIQRPAPGQLWRIRLADETILEANAVLVAPGSSAGIWEVLKNLGHTIVPPVPSLFTFNCKDKRIHGLLGLSVEHTTLSIPALKLQAAGPLLITHWGMSGPAVLRLSAWGARALASASYRFDLKVNWTGEGKPDAVRELLRAKRSEENKKLIANTPLFVPSRLWERLVESCGIPAGTRWADLSKKQEHALAETLAADRYQVAGKSTFKEEFVTAGGVSLDEVDFSTFGSKLHPGLFFGGEVLDIDAITGGFNFQAAWTGGHIAGESMATYLNA